MIPTQEQLATIVGSSDFLFKGDPETAIRELVRIMQDDELSPWDALDYADEVLGGFGVESISGPGDTGSLDYVNAGDTYAGTLAHDGERFLVTCWGDWLEGAELNHQQETNEVRCMYCGEWGEPEREDPEVADSTALCGSCGNEVYG